MNTPITSAHSPIHAGSEAHAEDSGASTSVPTLTHDPCRDGSDKTLRLAPDQADQFDDLATLGAEIRGHYQQFCSHARITLELAISLGGLLQRAKKQVGHGGWQAFLNKVGIEIRTAQHYTHLFKHREELQTKSENVSHLTIGGALQALRRGRQPSSLPPSPAPFEIRARETRVVIQADPIAMDNLADRSTSFADLSSSESANGILGTRSQTEATHADADHQDPKGNKNRKGYRLVNGTELLAHPNDDGLIPFDRTQNKLDTVADQNRNCPGKFRRNDGKVIFEQRCLVTLVRTANQILSGHKPIPSAEVEAFCNALGALRNTVVTLLSVQIQASERREFPIQSYYLKARG